MYINMMEFRIVDKYPVLGPIFFTLAVTLVYTLLRYIYKRIFNRTAEPNPNIPYPDLTKHMPTPTTAPAPPPHVPAYVPQPYQAETVRYVPYNQPNGRTAHQQLQQQQAQAQALRGPLRFLVPSWKFIFMLILVLLWFVL